MGFFIVMAGARGVKETACVVERVKMRSGAKCIIDSLEQAGVTTIFGLPGGTVLDLFAELYHSPIKFVLSRHEQGATHMADGYARATGRPGCCIATSGPGATNTITGLATANMDGVPLVCICGQVPSTMIGNDAFQEADTTGISRGVTKHNYLVKNVDDIPRVVAEAFYVATSGKPGPVLIDVPKDVQQGQTKVDRMPDGVPAMRGYRPASTGHPKQIVRLAEAINKAKRPLFYVGGGVIAGNASQELMAVVRKAQVPVTTTLMGLGSFPETDPLSLRMLGMHGSVAANHAVTECDLLVSIGARFDDRVTGKISEFAPGATVAHVDIDPSTISKSVGVDIPVVGDVKLVLAALLDQVEAKERTDWLKTIAEWQRDFPFGYETSSEELLPQYVVEQIYRATQGKAIIVTDVGQNQMWSAQFFKYTAPRTFLSSGGLGTMGFGLPAAIGAQIGKPDDVVFNISGDGGVQMNFQELVVAVEHELPINVVILNNGCLGMVRQWQEMFYKKEYSGSQLGQSGRGENEGISSSRSGYLPDFVALAKAHGAEAERVSARSEVADAIQRAIGSKRTNVIEFIVKGDANVYPMVPPGASLTEMIHSMS